MTSRVPKNTAILIKALTVKHSRNFEVLGI